MARRTPRPEAQFTTTLTPLRKSCEQCGNRLWVAYHCRRKVMTLEGHRPAQGGHVSVSHPRLLALSREISSRRGRTLGAAPWRIWLGCHCLDWLLAVHRAPQCPRDASTLAYPWSGGL